MPRLRGGRSLGSPVLRPANRVGRSPEAGKRRRFSNAPLGAGLPLPPSRLAAAGHCSPPELAPGGLKRQLFLHSERHPFALTEDRLRSKLARFPVAARLQP